VKTIGQHISNIRGLIKAYGRNQEGYTDEGLYSLFSVSRATILQQQLKKFMAISEHNWFRICMSLEIAKSHDCDCVPDKYECKVLRTKYKIPPVLVGRNNSKIQVRLLSGKTVNIVSEDEWFRKNKDTKEYYGSIVNHYLILWNVPLTLKVISVNGLWTNPIDLVHIPNCLNDGVEVGTCFDPLTQDYPLEDEYAEDVYMKVLKLLNIPLQLPQDQTNDSNEFIKL